MELKHRPSFIIKSITYVTRAFNYLSPLPIARSACGLLNLTQYLQKSYNMIFGKIYYMLYDRLLEDIGITFQKGLMIKPDN